MPPDTDRRNWILVAVVLVSAGVILALGLWAASSPGEDTGMSDGESVEQSGHNYTYVRTADPDATALVLRLSAEAEREIETHWTNFGRWNDTRMTLSKNVVLYETTKRAVPEAGVSGFRATTCGEGNGDSTPTIEWGIRSCEKRTTLRNANFTTEGWAGPGTEWMYAAAFGADEAEIGVEIHADGPLELSAASAETSLTILQENRTAQGAPEGGPMFKAYENVSIPNVSYGVFTIAGEWGQKPTFEARGQGRHYAFSPSEPLYENREGESVWVPGFPAPAGNYTIEIEGGRRSSEPGPGEVAGLVLGQIRGPGFVTDDGWFAPVGEDTS